MDFEELVNNAYLWKVTLADLETLNTDEPDESVVYVVCPDAVSAGKIAVLDPLAEGAMGIKNIEFVHHLVLLDDRIVTSRFKVATIDWEAG